MSGYLIEMMIFSSIYVASVYIIVRVVRKLNLNRNKRNDDDDGGVEFYEEPDLDLPPGITLPDNGPKVRIDDPEDVLV
jgi:hypothetical protein